MTRERMLCLLFSNEIERFGGICKKFICHLVEVNYADTNMHRLHNALHESIKKTQSSLNIDSFAMRINMVSPNRNLFSVVNYWLLRA